MATDRLPHEIITLAHVFVFQSHSETLYPKKTMAIALNSAPLVDLWEIIYTLISNIFVKSCFQMETYSYLGLIVTHPNFWKFLT
jgi:hypothetical protein